MSAWSQPCSQGLLSSSHDHRIFQNAPRRSRRNNGVQEICAELKMSRALEILLETGIGPEKISFRGHFKYKLGLSDLSLEEPDLRVRKAVVVIHLLHCEHLNNEN